MSQGSQDPLGVAAGDDAAKGPGVSGRRQKQTARGLSKGSPRRLAVALGEGKTQFPPADKLAGGVCERAPQQQEADRSRGLADSRSGRAALCKGGLQQRLPVANC